YACFATRYYQNNDRVCSTDEYWATGSVYVQRYVAKVVDNKPVPVASCSYNGNDESCPGSIADDARWNTGPKVHAPTYPSKPLPQVDGEVDDEVLRLGWLNSANQSGQRNLMDRAILARARELRGWERSAMHEKVDEIPFDFVRRRLSVVVRSVDGGLEMITKGAVEEMLAVST
ncbi:hypothetical protein ACQCQW_27050, partial [Ralstonia pseudosolanacearum]